MFYEHKGRYECPRIAQQFYDVGIETNRRVVAILMRGMNLYAKGFHRRQSSHGRGKAIKDIVKENLLNRQLEQSQIDDVWVTDITYIPCNNGHGRLYLSTCIDLATRIPRCYMVDSNMKKEIVIRPLQSYKG